MATREEMLASPWGSLGEPNSNYEIQRTADQSGIEPVYRPQDVFTFDQNGTSYARGGAPWESVYGGNNSQFFSGDPATYGAYDPQYGYGLRADIAEKMRQDGVRANNSPLNNFFTKMPIILGTAGMGAAIGGGFAAGEAAATGLEAGGLSYAGEGVGISGAGTGAVGTGAMDMGVGLSGVASAMGAEVAAASAAAGEAAAAGTAATTASAVPTITSEVGALEGGANLTNLSQDFSFPSNFADTPVDLNSYPSNFADNPLGPSTPGSNPSSFDFPSNFADNPVTKAATETATKPSTGPTLQSAWESLTKDPFGAALKVGPLALGAMGMMNQRAAADKFRDQLAQIGGPQRAIGEQLLNDYQAGRIRPADAGRIAAWESSALAAAKQFYSRAGLSTSTSANTTYSDISSRAELMKQQALEASLKTGLDALNITDRYQAMALQAEMQADQQAAAAGMQFLNAYGSWLRAIPQMTGQTAAK